MDKTTRDKFHNACIRKLQTHLNVTLVEDSALDTCLFASNNLVRVVCRISARHSNGLYRIQFVEQHRDFLRATKPENAFVALGCGSVNYLFMIPFWEFSKWYPPSKSWDIRILEEPGGGFKVRRRFGEPIDLTENYLIREKLRGAKNG